MQSTQNGTTRWFERTQGESEYLSLCKAHLYDDSLTLQQSVVIFNVQTKSNGASFILNNSLVKASYNFLSDTQ